MLFRISVVALSTLLATPLAAAGQLIDGAKVRVKIAGELADDGSVTQSDGSQSIVARFLAMEADHLILAVDSTSKSIRLPKAAVTELEISRGRSQLKGALIGAGIGGLVGLVWGSVERSRCLSKPTQFLCGLSFIGPMAVASPAGALVGAMIGKPQWAKVSPTAFAPGASSAPTRPAGARFPSAVMRPSS
jgi:hypothetical protein